MREKNGDMRAGMRYIPARSVAHSAKVAPSDISHTFKTFLLVSFHNFTFF